MGVFGFLRNPTHHRLLGELALERVMQQLGMIDYLLGLLDGAQRERTSEAKTPAPDAK
jgi:hypothetical protein